jgi:hypothetical protein
MTEENAERSTSNAQRPMRNYAGGRRDRHRYVPGAVTARAFRHYARTGTLAVRSSLPQLTQAPLMARRIAFQMQ